MNMRRIMSILVIAGGVSYAQPQRGFGQRGDGGTPPTPAQIAQRETNRLTVFFTLTTAQQSTVLGILTMADTQIQTIAAQIHPLRTTLVAAIKADNKDQITSTVQQISNLQQQEQVIRADVAGQIYTTVLTATQQAQVGTGLGPLMEGGPGFGGFGGPR
jgi:hypothetical protein